MILYPSCLCPPLDPSDERLNEEIVTTEAIILANVNLVDSTSNCFEFRVIEVYKGNLSLGKKMTGYYNRMCGPIINTTGDWILSGREGNYFDLRPCGLSFNLESPEILPPIPPSSPDRSMNKEKREIEQQWKRKNIELKKRILKKLKTVHNTK